MKWIFPQHFVNTCIQNRNWTNNSIFTIGSVASNWACALLYCYKYGPDPAALAASQLQNEVQAVLLRPRHPLRSQPGVSDGNSPVSRCQQITFRATLIFHLIDGLLSTTAAHEVRRVGVLTCGSCHLERSADHIRTVPDPVKFRKLLKSHYFCQACHICWFLCFFSMF